MTWKTMQSKLPRLAAVVAAVVGLIALSGAALAQPSTPHQFYGDGLAEGDVVGLGEDTATANAAGEWSIQSTGAMAAEVGEDSFTLNGAPAAAVLTEAGGTLTHVALTEAMMGEDDEMMGEDGDGEMMGEDDGEMMGEDEDGEMMGEDEDHMLDEDDSMMGGDHDYPGTGSGGLADGGVSAGLIGLLIALGAVAVAGVGYRRIRNRA